VFHSKREKYKALIIVVLLFVCLVLPRTVNGISPVPLKVIACNEDSAESSLVEIDDKTDIEDDMQEKLTYRPSGNDISADYGYFRNAIGSDSCVWVMDELAQRSISKCLCLSRYVASDYIFDS